MIKMKPVIVIDSVQIKQWTQTRTALNYNIYLVNYYNNTMSNCLNRLTIKGSLSRSSCKKKGFFQTLTFETH